MNRRSFLGLLASVPVLGALGKLPPLEPSSEIEPYPQIEADLYWTMYSPYVARPGLSWHNPPVVHIYRTEGFYAWASADAPRQPIMLADWGFNRGID